MALNGRLPASALAPIAGGRLRKDAALRWNAMNLQRRRQGKSTILPNGPFSSYRDIVGQGIMRRMWCARGKCGNAAVPGTSNHGWGVAVDNNNPAGVEASGPPFGFSKRWSDAPWESWHVKWGGFGRILRPDPDDLIIRRGSRGPAVVTLKRLLMRIGYMDWAPEKKVGRLFGDETRRLVKKFQKNHNIKADGVVGPKTWAALRKVARRR